MSIADQIAAVVERLRPTHDDLALPDTVAVWRKVESRDSRNNIVEVPTNIGMVRASIDPANRAGRAYVAGAVEDQEQLYAITLPHGTDVKVDDELRAGERRFSVREVGKGGGFSIAVDVIAQEVS